MLEHVGVRVAVAALGLSLLAIGVVDLVNPQWSWVEYPASYFVHGRAGWLIPVAALGIALGAALVAVLVARRGVRRAGVVLLGCYAAGFVLVGLFPADPPGRWDRAPSAAATVHGVGGLVAFVVLPAAAVLLARAVRRPAVRVLAVAAVVAFVAFVVTWVDVIGGPALSVGGYGTVTGLAERVMVWVYTAWLVVLAVGMRDNTSGSVPVLVGGDHRCQVVERDDGWHVPADDVRAHTADPSPFDAA